MIKLVETVTNHDSAARNLVTFLLVLFFFASSFLSYLGSSASNEASPTMTRMVRVLAGFFSASIEMIFGKVGVQLIDRSNAPDPVQIISDDERLELVASLEEKIKIAAAEDAFRSDVLAKVEAIRVDTKEHERIASIDTQFKAAQERLDDAIVLLHRKANINMLVGIILSALGIFFLGVTVVPGLFNRLFGTTLELFQPIDNIKDVTQFWIHYVPRLALAIVLELFAYFFLNLYKANAAETRYYHNEISNIAARHSALMSASNPRDADLLKLVVTELLRTERNGVLTKSQTTVEIARAKAEAESAKDLVTVITKLTESFGRALGRSGNKESDA